MRQPASFQEFWPVYLREHSHPLTRRLHFAGTGLAIVLLAAGVFLSPWLFIAAPVAGYAIAWASHLVIEKNRPATFRYPVWSLKGDLRMFRLMLLGRMEAEIRRLGARLTSP